MEKDREKEELLIEKGGTINRLASELEAAQSRLASGETARLKERLAQLLTERNAAKEQVKELGVSIFTQVSLRSRIGNKEVLTFFLTELKCIKYVSTFIHCS